MLKLHLLILSLVCYFLAVLIGIQFLVGLILSLLKLKLKTVQQSSIKLVEVRPHVTGQIFTKELTTKILLWVRLG